MGAPVKTDISVNVEAKKFAQAMSACDGVPTFALTGKGTAVVKGKGLRVTLKCGEHGNAIPTPAGQRVSIDGAGLVEALKTAKPFMGTDGNHAWCRSVLVKGTAVFATNNATMVCVRLPKPFPVPVVIPEPCVRTLLAVSEAPVIFQHVPDGSITFHYENGAWMHSQLLFQKWPDVSAMFPKKFNWNELDTDIFNSLKKIKDFLEEDKKVRLSKGKLETPDCVIEHEGQPIEGVFNYDNLSMFKGFNFYDNSGRALLLRKDQNVIGLVYKYAE